MEPNLFDLCWQATLFLSPTTYDCDAVFQRYDYFQKTKHRFQLQPEENIRCALMTTSTYLTNLQNKLKDKIRIEICECGHWTEFAKASVCIILVVLVCQEPTKIYTGLKVVRVLKRLRNTVLGHKIVKLMYFIEFKNSTPQVEQARNQSQIFNRKSISGNTMHHQSLHLIQIESLCPLGQIVLADIWVSLIYQYWPKWLILLIGCSRCWQNAVIFLMHPDNLCKKAQRTKSRQLSCSNASRCVFINKQTRWIMKHASAVEAKTKASSWIRLIKNHSKILKLLQFEQF